MHASISYVKPRYCKALKHPNVVLWLLSKTVSTLANANDIQNSQFEDIACNAGNEDQASAFGKLVATPSVENLPQHEVDCYFVVVKHLVMWFIWLMKSMHLQARDTRSTENNIICSILAFCSIQKPT